MTEVGLATLNPPSGEIRQGSIGRPIGGFASRCATSGASRSRSSRSAGSGSAARSRMAGYWEAPEATEEVVLDGWLDSGDLARADEDGYLWFFGRKKQVIVHDGSNISPYEVEGALVEHPAVALAGAVGVHDAGPRRERARLRDAARGRRAPSRRRPDRLLPRARSATRRRRRSSSSTRCRSTRPARSTASGSSGWPKTTSA